jgi:hypothetical protein
MMNENKNIKLHWCRIMEVFWLAVSMIVLGHGQSPAWSEKELLNKAAARFNKNLADFRIDPADLAFYGAGEFQLKLFSVFMNDPVKAAPYIRVLTRTLLNNADSLWMLSFFSWARIDEGVRRGLIERPEKVLRDSLTKLNDLRRTLIQTGFESSLARSLPDSIAFGLSMILLQVEKSHEWIKSGVGDISGADIDTIIKGLLSEEGDAFSNTKVKRLIETADLKSLAAGSMDLCYVLQAAVQCMQTAAWDQRVDIKTPWGKLALGSLGNDEYDEPPYMLVIDWGGDDTYVSGGVADIKTPVSVIVDYKGDDTYRGTIGSGTGICGYGMVVDMQGDDHYRAGAWGLGAGMFGQGIIYDRSGNDEYSTDRYGEGAGLFGTGIIADAGGNDTYSGFQCCQGFGFVKGCGVLLDASGDDNYVARDDTAKYPSPQSAQHNASLSQGMGYGVRADFTDGHSLAGGVGMLIDGIGADRYSCGVFGQGCGYWFGTGVLADYEGNDEYSGVWYTQGAGAHFAVGVLLDSAGDDRYVSTMNMAQGAGHDFTLGLLVDYSGDDAYDAPNLSLGSGNANGMGLFMDQSGNDKYNTHGGITLGGASTESRGGLRDLMKTLGIFIDGGGQDSYKEPSIGNGKYWRQKPPLGPPLETEWCIGLDL